MVNLRPYSGLVVFGQPASLTIPTKPQDLIHVASLVPHRGPNNLDCLYVDSRVVMYVISHVDMFIDFCVDTCVVSHVDTCVVSRLGTYFDYHTNLVLLYARSNIVRHDACLSLVLFDSLPGLDAFLDSVAR